MNEKIRDLAFEVMTNYAKSHPTHSRLGKAQIAEMSELIGEAAGNINYGPEVWYVTEDGHTSILNASSRKEAINRWEEKHGGARPGSSDSFRTGKTGWYGRTAIDHDGIPITAMVVKASCWTGEL